MKAVDDSFKGQEFYEKKNKELNDILSDMETTDVLTVFAGFMTDVIGGSLKNESLEDARVLMDSLKSQVLGCLVKNGWE